METFHSLKYPDTREFILYESVILKCLYELNSEIESKKVARTGGRRDGSLCLMSTEFPLKVLGMGDGDCRKTVCMDVKKLYVFCHNIKDGQIDRQITPGSI